MTLGNVGIAMNNIEVKGEQNLNLLLASIQTIKKVKTELEKLEESERKILCDEGSDTQ